MGQRSDRAVSSSLSSVVSGLWHIGDFDKSADTVRFDGGVIAALHVSRTCAWGHDVRVEIVGDEGSIFVGNASSRDGVYAMRREDGVSFPQDYRALHADAYAAELGAFVAACTGEGPRGPGLEDDVRAVAVGVAARASAVAGRPLEVGPDWPWGQR